MKKQMTAALLSLGLLAGCAPAPDPVESAPSASTSAAASASSSTQVTYEEVTLYVPNETADGLIEKTVQVEQTGAPAEELVQALVGEGALPKGTAVGHWSSSSDTPPAVTVDLNAAFAEGIPNQGTAGETMILASLVNTLWAYYTPSELTVTADGNPIETGHNVYDMPFTAPMTVQ